MTTYPANRRQASCHPEKENRAGGLCGQCAMRARRGLPLDAPSMSGRQSVTHGESYSPEYAAWINAKNRTTLPSHPEWKNYGARGIRMAAEWIHDFEAFRDHIGPRPGLGFSLDRIDNDGDYAPGNVRWATASQQRLNQRRSRHNQEGWVQP